MSLKRKIQYFRRKFSSKYLHAFNEAKSSLAVTMPKPIDVACMNFMIDFELIWGNGNLGGVDHSLEKRINDARIQRKAFRPFLDLVEELGFPTSWAVLGKLVESKVELSQKEKFKPSWTTLTDWYEFPQKVEQALLDGQDCIKEILSLSAPKELLSHGYAHIDYWDTSTSLGVARKDLQLSLMLLGEFAHAPITGFVYPCNKHGHRELLEENGIRVVRGDQHQWDVKTNLIQTPLGFWISPGVMSFKELLPELERAVLNKSWIHPWMHLIECDLKENDLNDFYRPLFDWSLEKAAQRKLKLISFADLNHLIRS